MTEGYHDSEGCNKYTFNDGITRGCWYNNGSFVGDNKTELDLEDDAAYINWGRDWRMPSKEQLTELRTTCTCTFIFEDKTWTEKITGPNGNSILLPTAGYYFSEYFRGGVGEYWSRTLSTEYSCQAFFLWFDGPSLEVGSTTRQFGIPVRPVRASASK